MHPEIRQATPGSCPKCGMALERVAPSKSKTTEYVCPMHPEVVRTEPGNCPICGMALGPRNSETEDDNPELIDMTRRFWVSTVLALPVFVMAMVADMLPGFTEQWISYPKLQLIEFLLATPVVLCGGWPFFRWGWASLLTRHLNMFTLISLGVGVAWIYSVVGTFLPEIFPTIPSKSPCNQ